MKSQPILMKRNYTGIGLDNPKNIINIGLVLRMAGNFNVEFVAISGRRYKKQPTDTMCYSQHHPVFHNLKSLHDIIPFDCIPVAVDLVDNAISLPMYEHPKKAFYIFGAEDATLGKRILNWCRDVIYIPTNRCLNLAMAVGIVLYDKMVKEQA